MLSTSSSDRFMVAHSLRELWECGLKVSLAAFLSESVRIGKPCLDGGGDLRVGEAERERSCLGEADRPPDSDSSGTMDEPGPSLS